MRWIKNTVIAVLLAVTVLAGGLRAQEAKQSEREAMYRRYLEFPSYVKGGSIQPHWMADGSSFWYAEGTPTNTNDLAFPQFRLPWTACFWGNLLLVGRCRRTPSHPIISLMVTHHTSAVLTQFTNGDFRWGLDNKCHRC